MNTFFETIKEIHNNLIDEQSKDIFVDRLLYSLLDDKKYIDEIVRRYVLASGLNEKGVIKYLLVGAEDVTDSDEIVVYGCGEMGEKIYAMLGEKIVCFCDRDPKKQRNGFCGKKVISLEQLIEKKSVYKVIIGSIDYYMDIYDTLRKVGIQLVSDNHEIIQEWMKIVDRQYFDTEIIKYGNDEVFIDGGCLNYASSKQFLKECPSVKKIFAFEPDSESAKRCRMEAGKMKKHEYEIIEKGLYSVSTQLNFRSMGNGCSGISNDGECIVNVCSIDEEIHERVTFIKMDIEGAELEALKGAEETIKRYRPKLAICVYHKPEDIVEIPKYILNINPDYKLYLRHYSDNAGETVLYAI